MCQGNNWSEHTQQQPIRDNKNNKAMDDKNFSQSPIYLMAFLCKYTVLLPIQQG